MVSAGSLLEIKFGVVSREGAVVTRRAGVQGVVSKFASRTGSLSAGSGVCNREGERNSALSWASPVNWSRSKSMSPIFDLLVGFGDYEELLEIVKSKLEVTVDGEIKRIVQECKLRIEKDF